MAHNRDCSLLSTESHNTFFNIGAECASTQEIQHSICNAINNLLDDGRNLFTEGWAACELHHDRRPRTSWRPQGPKRRKMGWWCLDDDGDLLLLLPIIDVKPQSAFASLARLLDHQVLQKIREDLVDVHGVLSDETLSRKKMIYEQRPVGVRETLKALCNVDEMERQVHCVFKMLCRTLGLFTVKPIYTGGCVQNIGEEVSWCPNHTQEKKAQ